MRPSPPVTELPRYPVVGGVALLAVGVTVAWWMKVDISPLFASPMIRRGEWWRLLTCILPHGGILHLAFDVYWLWVFGTLVEEQFGPLWTALLITLFGFGSSAFEFAFLDGGIGLSGVGYGLFGMLWILAVYDARFREAVDRSTVQLFVVWFFLCIVTTVTEIMPIANVAHGVGALLGIGVGYAIAKPPVRVAAAAGVVAVLCFGAWAATEGRPTVNLSSRNGYEEAKWGYDALAKGDNTNAVRWLRDATRYRPNIAAFWFDLGIGYENLKKYPDAVSAYRRAAELGDSSAAYYVGTLYERGGEEVQQDGSQAAYWYHKAANSDDPEELNNIAWEFATSKDPAVRNPSAALELARKTVDMEKDKPDPEHLDTLAEALYVNQRYQEAVELEKKALTLANDKDKPVLTDSLHRFQDALTHSQAR